MMLKLASYMTPGFPVSLFEAIADVIGADLTLITDLSGPEPGTDPFDDGTFDLGWICSTSFVSLSLRTAHPSVVLSGVGWAPADPAAAGRPVYFGELITPPGSTAESLSDLRGGRIGCNDPVSLSGHYSLRFAIDEMGEDPNEFADLVFTGGHNRSIEMVARGELDAAVVDSIVLARARRDGELSAGVRTIDRLGPWPVQPLVARSTLPAETVAEVRSALLASNSDPLMRAELNSAALASFVSTHPDHYGVVREAMRRLRVAGSAE